MDIPKQVICRNCGSIDDYWTEFKNGQQVATCNGCNKYIKNIPYQLPKFYVGKYKGETISSNTDLNYLKWFLEKTNPKANIKTAVEERINQLISSK